MKSVWGYCGVVQAPDGAIWKIATSPKKNTGPATREIDELASKEYYTRRGLTVSRSFGGKSAEFAAGESGRAKLALYKRGALAKDLGVSAGGVGWHRIVLGGTTEPFTDPDGFLRETAQS
ncbi:hypothetical protein [Kribbella sp. NPDC004536]|uniref:hypothetical protein n=1 Tax=Kribbella sp. NPDC004536 TaxID=3364106 RepID=UPI00369397CC